LLVVLPPTLLRAGNIEIPVPRCKLPRFDVDEASSVLTAGLIVFYLLEYFENLAVLLWLNAGCSV